jgi:hypothetical protein
MGGVRTTSGSPQAKLGNAYNDLNMIVRRINRRRTGEPTTKELEQITQLKAKIRELKGLD